MIPLFKSPLAYYHASLLLPLSSAYITGFTAPSSAAAGSSITATLGTAIYSENWVDYSIVWGLATAEYDCGQCVGTQIG